MILSLLAAATVTLSSPQQTIEGFGASTVWALRNTGFSPAVADFLWHPDKGIGLSIVRSQITNNGYPLHITVMDSTGTAVEDTDWTAEIQATSRGARLMGTAWTAASAWQTGGTLQNFPFAGDLAGGTLQAGHYGDFATVITNWCDRAYAAGALCYAVSPANESDIASGVTYGNMAWTSANLVTFVKSNLGPALATWAQGKGVPIPRVIVPETYDTAGTLGGFVSAFDADSTALPYVGGYAYHAYSGTPSRPSTTRPAWQTEWHTSSAWDGGMSDAIATANNVYTCLTTGNVSAYLFWFAEDVSDNNNSGLVGTASANWNNPSLSLADWNAPVFTKRAYAFGAFSKFVRPGSVMVSSSGAPAGVNLVAFLDARGNPAVIAINTNGTTTGLTVNYSGGLGAWPLSHTVYEVSGSTNGGLGTSGNLENKGTTSVSAGSFTWTLAATSVTAFVVPLTNQGRFPGRLPPSLPR
jgi:glucuronoarabinoxylan endo-1,4-beta-xylanase